MWQRIAWGLLLTFALSPAAAMAAGPADGDGDGIADRDEEVLGTEPGAAESFQTVIDEGLESETRRARTGYDPSKDFLTIEFCHVGDDRYLWRATFAGPPKLEDTVFHLYVDADADETTGRKGSPEAAYRGTEYMLTVAGGTGHSSHYTPDGLSGAGPPVNFAVEGNRLLISADVDLGRDADGVRYDLYVLCHTVTNSGRSPRMSDSSAKVPVAGVPLSPRKKRMRPQDYGDNHQVAATFGIDLLQKTLAERSTIVVGHDRLELDGFEIDNATTRKWPHLKRIRKGAVASTTAPQAGRYHVGFMMYDDASDERVVISVGGKVRGVAVARKDNNRTWLYWLEQPIEFAGGERVELKAAGSGGKHGICNLLFLSKPPQVRTMRFAVEHMTSRVEVDRPGRVTLSWTTTWPCHTRLEYGESGEYGTVVENQSPCLAHRVVLEGLDPAKSYHGRAAGTRPSGERFRGEDFAFTAVAPQPPPSRAANESIALRVQNPHPLEVRGWPVTGGVPFPQGALAGPEQVRLSGGEGEVPVQTKALARWPDGSLKWLLVSFAADVAARGEATYRLEFGRRVQRPEVPRPIAVRQAGQGLSIETGRAQWRIDRQGNLAGASIEDRDLLPGDQVAYTSAEDAQGHLYRTTAEPAKIEIEEAGPVRVVVKVVSPLVDAGGNRLLTIEKRIEAYRGTAFLRLHHTFVVTRPETFTSIRRMTYHVPLAAEACSWRAGVVAGDAVVLDSPGQAVRQRLDDELVVTEKTKEHPLKARLIGSLVCRAKGGPAVAVRDAWQNYPKGFSLAGDGVGIELCPPLDAKLYDAFPFEKEGHHLYYYLLGGKYRLKRGVAKTHELLLCLEPGERREQIVELFQQPLVVTPPPEWTCASKAFYDVAPRNTEKFALYEAAIDRNLTAYADRRQRQHDFGMLNYGDWYGERGSNWGNIEYDTQQAFLLEYVRSGNPAAFFLGHAAELHNRDVDTVHWHTDPGQVGAVYIHQMCHVGEYYDHGVPGTLGFPRAGYTVSHAWCEGHFGHYFLTGDRRSYETGIAVADYFIRRELGRPYDFSSTRTPGWHLIMLAAAYHATGDPYYLNAARVVADRVIEVQDKLPRPLPEYQRQGRKPYQQGGWTRMLVPGHCRCEPRHQGNAGFMIAILLSGLKYYYDITGDERAKESLIRGAHYLLDETYSDQTHGFRYTSCPAHRYGHGASPLMVEGIARAYLWTGDARFRRVLEEALPLSAAGSPYGKSFSMYYRTGPRVLADLEAAGLELNEVKK